MQEKRYLKTYKTELDLTKEQEQKLSSCMGTLRFVYNLYLSENQRTYQAKVEEKCPGFLKSVEEVREFNKGKPTSEKKQYPKAPKVKNTLMSPASFSQWLKKEYIPANPDKAWINETHSKAVKQTVTDAYEAFMKFFRGAGYPKFRKRNDRDCSYYFVRNEVGKPIRNERHYIQVPGIGKCHIKEKGYIPAATEKNEILSGRITRKNGKYYVSVQVIWNDPVIARYALNKGEGIGIDLGVKEFAVCSDGRRFSNVNRSKKMKKLDRNVRKLGRRVSRKMEAAKKNPKKEDKTNRYSKRLERTKRQLACTHERMERIRKDHRRKAVHEIVSTLVQWISIEDLNVSGMMKNRHLSKSIGGMQFYAFRQDLCAAALKRGIEVRLAGRFYASSKICHHCHHKYKDLSLKDREWECPVCHEKHDRDLNAALNLRDMNEYTVWKLEAPKRKNGIVTVMI